MQWQNPIAVPFTRIAIVLSVPSEAGVFAICEGSVCLYLGCTWNLRARLLEVSSLMADTTGFNVICECCPESQCEERKSLLEAELDFGRRSETLSELPGIHIP